MKPRLSGWPLPTTKTKTKQRMTRSTSQKDSSDSIFCFVGPLGRQNSTPCFVRRNTFFTKAKLVPFGETSYWNRFDWMKSFLVPTSLYKSHKRVIQQSNTFLNSYVQCIWLVRTVFYDCSMPITVFLFCRYSKGSLVPLWQKQKNYFCFVFVSVVGKGWPYDLIYLLSCENDDFPP